jgi:hypothetical protein
MGELIDSVLDFIVDWCLRIFILAIPFILAYLVYVTVKFGL